MPVSGKVPKAAHRCHSPNAAQNPASAIIDQYSKSDAKTAEKNMIVVMISVWMTNRTVASSKTEETKTATGTTSISSRHSAGGFTKKPDFLSGFIGRRHGREIRIPGNANTADQQSVYYAVAICTKNFSGF
jgi:hypothetical protein